MSKRNPCQSYKKPKHNHDRKKPRGNIIHCAVGTVDNDFRKVVRGLSGA